MWDNQETKPMTANAYLCDDPVTQHEDSVIREAADILYRRMHHNENFMTDTDLAEQFLQMKLADLPYESFGMLLLTTSHQVIEFVEVFRGTIAGCSIELREVVRTILQHNASAVILAHNHPSGDSTPSEADRQITKRITSFVSEIDVRVLDHIVVARNNVTCFSKIGLI